MLFFLVYRIKQHLGTYPTYLSREIGRSLGSITDHSPKPRLQITTIPSICSTHPILSTSRNIFSRPSSPKPSLTDSAFRSLIPLQNLQTLLHDIQCTDILPCFFILINIHTCIPFDINQSPLLQPQQILSRPTSFLSVEVRNPEPARRLLTAFVARPGRYAEAVTDVFGTGGRGVKIWCGRKTSDQSDFGEWGDRGGGEGAAGGCAEEEGGGGGGEERAE